MSTRSADLPTITSTRFTEPGNTSDSAARALMQANVTSRFDYCNGLLVVLPQHLIDRLQRVQNAAALVVAKTRICDHITGPQRPTLVASPTEGGI